MVFHYRTTKCNNEKTLIDDSKTMGNAMELVLGKKFKLEVWEVIVQKMALNEVASFRVHRSVNMQKKISISKQIKKFLIGKF